nr:MAG TPA: hypothetical protein [Caudoviricetes sp.]
MNFLLALNCTKRLNRLYDSVLFNYKYIGTKKEE